MPRRTKARRKRKPRLTIDDAARRLSDIYCLWRFCGTRACRRGEACRGDARICLRALPLVSPDALEYLHGYDEGLAEGLTFDEMLANNEAEWAAVEAWQTLVLSTRPDSGTP